MPFAPYLDRWELVADGAPIHTHSSDLLPVRRADGTPGMLKLAREAEEKLGGVVMTWWNGRGAARVLAHEAASGALLLERATGTRSLTRMVREGRDDEATRILCAVVGDLHARPEPPPAGLLTLREWFVELAPMAARHGGVLAEAEATARALLDAPRDPVVLHGDLHHDNVLDFGERRGWLAIDPKRLHGERGFDYANMLCNPEEEFALAPQRVARRVEVVAEAARLDRRRLLQWLLAYAGLSAAWWLGDGADEEASHPLAVAGEASRLLALVSA
ncbi:aminoglycoside phosphotransferase family protein [Luteimonas aquatica]|uniref:aminoglycoside phosphotransferase family protein n=1 Tax=Luteimonas aquatica TaxID=450364 RepID=UPI001F55DDFF|nr:aminoglycoside phosphotransferase family protein [Luteimonas aquatica]